MYYTYQENKLNWKNTNLNDLAAGIEGYLYKEYGYTGCYYLYHKEILNERLKLFSENFPDSRLYYSVKSLSNINILKVIRNFSNFGLDVVSGGEILRGLEAGFQGSDMVYAGVGKTEDEIRLGLINGLKSFHVESVAEIDQIKRVAEAEKIPAPVTLRLNPDISVNTHKYIVTGIESSKFGINSDELKLCLSRIKESGFLKLRGLQIHLGSQLLESEVYLKGLDFLVNIVNEFKGEMDSDIEYLSLGGGFGIDYGNVFQDKPSKEFPVSEFAQALKKKTGLACRVDFEPGRYISAHSGLLMAHVLYMKPRKECMIAITDAGMSELIRPALYEAVHQILPLEKNNEVQTYDIVGPICESGDFFAKKIEISRLQEGSRIAIAHAGAYGSVMASNYNSRPFVPEILIRENGFEVIRKPQAPKDLFRLEL